LNRLKNNPFFGSVSIVLIISLSLLSSCIWKENSVAHPLPYIAPPLLNINPVEKQQLSNRVASYFKESLLRYEGIFSGGILVAKGGHVLFEHYAGFTDYPKKIQPLQEDSPLHIASTSKTFTAIAILQLVQQQKISLDDTLELFFEKWPYPGVTIKQLLTHRSGLPNYTYFMEADKQGKLAYTNKDIIDWMIQHKPAPHARPDSRFEYCNTNYLLFLGMKNTFVFEPADAVKATPSFVNSSKPWPLDHLDLTYGDKNIYSTPRDLLKWDQALYTKQLVSDSLLELAFTPYSFERPGQNNYGLGFRLKLLPNQKKIIYHFGRWHGNNAAFARLTDEQVTVIILGNKFNRQIYTAASKSYSLFGPYGGKQQRDEE